jgi:geranylgeranyl transferase type-2 subunit beta
MPDVFHTLFGLAGLSLMQAEELEPIDPSYCMPSKVLQRLRLI